MPRQDSLGRWISDDGHQYWDGAAWRPLGAQAPKSGGSAFPAVAIGCGFALVLALVVVIGFTVLLLNSPGAQRSFCNGYTNGEPGAACPFHPSP